MGLAASAYLAGWLLTLYIEVFRANAAAIFVFFLISKNVTIMPFLFNYLAFAIALTNYAFFVTKIFKNLKIAAGISNFLQIISVILFLYLLFISEEINNSLYKLSCLFPNSCMILILLPHLSTEN